MTTLALLTENEELLAFLALAGDGEIPPGTSRHDCLIMGIPEREELFDHPLGAFLQANKLEEFVCQAADLGDRLELQVTMADATLFLLFTENELGTWHYVQGGQQSGSGRCAFAGEEL